MLSKAPREQQCCSTGCVCARKHAAPLIKWYCQPCQMSKSQVGKEIIKIANHPRVWVEHATKSHSTLQAMILCLHLIDAISDQTLEAALSHCNGVINPSAHLGVIHICVQVAIIAGCRAVDHSQLLMEAAGSHSAAIRMVRSALWACSILKAASCTGCPILKDDCNTIPPAQQASDQPHFGQHKFTSCRQIRPE